MCPQILMHIFKNSIVMKWPLNLFATQPMITSTKRITLIIMVYNVQQESDEAQLEQYHT